MTRAAAWAGALLAAAAAVSACGSDEPSGAGGTQGTGGGQGGAGGDPTPPDSCVRPGDKGNDKGVGEYCTPVGGECQDFPEAGLCLATVGQDQWMCTRIGCDETTDCGEGAGCLIVDGEGSACVPCRCDDRGVGCSGGGGAGGGGGGGSGGSGGGGGAG